MSQADYDQAPSTLMVRELRTGGKTLVTTLLCPKATHKSALKTLFQSRWHVELDLRTIKSTLGMEQLSCQTPTMVIKEMWASPPGLQSHSADDGSSGATHRHEATPTEFQAHPAALDRLGTSWPWWQLRLDAGRPVGPDRATAGRQPARTSEPRAIKRRPKPYPLLTKPRAIARADIRKHGHPESLRSAIRACPLLRPPSDLAYSSPVRSLHDVTKQLLLLRLIHDSRSDPRAS